MTTGTLIAANKTTHKSIQNQDDVNSLTGVLIVLLIVVIINWVIKP